MSSLMKATPAFFKLTPVFLLAGLMIAGYDALTAAPIAVIYSCIIAVFFFKINIDDVIRSAIASSKEIQIALFILMIAYALAESFMSTGVGASVIILALKVGITAKTVAVVAAGVTAVLSVATGTSWGTFAACAPIFLWLTHIVGGDILLTASAIAGGSCFGDNIGLISDTTIVSSGIQNVEIIERVRHQGVWSLLVLIIGLIAFYLYGGLLGLPSTGADVSAAIAQIPSEVMAKLAIEKESAVKLLEQVNNGVPLYMVTPLVIVIACAVFGLQTFICLLAGLASSFLLGRLAGTVESTTSYLDMMQGGFSSAGSWVIVMMMWVSAFGGVMGALNAFDPVSKLISKASNSVKQLMFFNGVFCIAGNATLADEMAQIVTVGPIIKEVVDTNVVGSEEDIHKLKLRNATFSDAMGVFGSQLIPWHGYVVFYLGMAHIVYPLFDITPIGLIKYNFLAMIAVFSMLLLTLTGWDRFIPLFGLPSEPDVQLKKNIKKDTVTVS
ncbi:MAG: hypothetical protein KGV46_02165 [Pasteurella sp.]|nr:hypothetical protein [Pasteurella sp.]